MVFDSLISNCIQGWGNQHFIGQAGIAFAVLNMVILKITCQTCMLSQNIGQAMA